MLWGTKTVFFQCFCSGLLKMALPKAPPKGKRPSFARTAGACWMSRTTNSARTSGAPVSSRSAVVIPVAPLLHWAKAQRKAHRSRARTARRNEAQRRGLRGRASDAIQGRR